MSVHMRGMRWVARSRLAEHRIYLPLARLVYPGRVVGGQTQMVIDGFTRSGVTFAVVAFQMAQRSPVRLAHHLHAPAQILSATRRGIPTLVLIRDPEDAVLSAIIREPYVTPDAALRAYARFYTRVEASRSLVTVAPFTQLTRDLGVVIREVNGRFGTSFDEFRHTEENVRQVFHVIEDRSRRPPWSAELGLFEDGRIGFEEYRRAVAARSGQALGALPETRVPRPSAAREALKEDLRHLVGRHRGLVARARGVYETLVGSEP